MPTEIGIPGPTILLPTGYTHRLREGVTIPRSLQGSDSCPAGLASTPTRVALNIRRSPSPIRRTAMVTVSLPQSTTVPEADPLADIWGVSYTEEVASAWANPNVKAQLKIPTTDQANLWHDMVVRYLNGEQIYTVSTVVTPGSPPPYDTTLGGCSFDESESHQLCRRIRHGWRLHGQIRRKPGQGNCRNRFQFPDPPCAAVSSAHPTQT